jgi:hypothetical protein
MQPARSRPAPAGHGIPGPAAARTGWAVAAAVTAMVSWVAGVALIPPDARLEKGPVNLARVLRAHTAQLNAAALLAVLGAVLLAGFFAALTRIVREGQPGWGLLRVSLAACVITQTMVAIGASFGLTAVNAAAGNAPAGLVALAWRSLWLTFLASAVPTIMFTVTGVLGLRQAGLSPTWVSALAWLSAASHLLPVLAVAQQGAFAPDGLVPALIPLTTVIWILTLAATLPASMRAAAASAAHPTTDDAA